jgi:signal transduction histidine kinase
VELSRVTDAGKKLKEQQELIVRMEKMALVGRITSSIAHSIRNPLMVIGGFARSILKNTPANDPKRDFIESIVGEARHLEGVLDEILTYSDSLYPTRDFWDVNQLVESSLKEIKKSLIEKQCHCIFEAINTLPLVYIDFKQVSYCVRTLIMSNIDNSRPEEIRVLASEQSGRVEICIESRGYTLPAGDFDMLSTPYDQSRDQGPGLGLALCKSMLEKQDIPLSIFAPLEGGITYTIALPTQKEELTHEQTTGS